MLAKTWQCWFRFQIIKLPRFTGLVQKLFSSPTGTLTVNTTLRKAPAFEISREFGTSTKNTDMDKFGFPERLKGIVPSVWNEYTALAAKYNPLNLGQGFPDFPPPSYVIDALADATRRDPLLNQYTRGFGHPRLVQALAKVYSKVTHRDINPLTEIIVTCGAYEALYASIMGHVDKGDEVIIIEPYFDCYEPMVKMAHGTPRFIALKPRQCEGTMTTNDLILDEDALRNMFNEKTKIIILNTPHNPTGKVFTEKELCLIADLCKKWNVLCLSDEVYEFMVYEGREHIRICNLPGMWERTISIGSAGKAFSVTGWKMGWAYGPANLIMNLQLIHQVSVYTCSTPIQEAVACGMELELNRFDSPESYFKSFSYELRDKRDLMVGFLKEAGMNPIIPEGGYFMIADWSKLESKIDLSSENDKYRDYRFTKWMTKNIGIQAIPTSAFYSDDHKNLGESYVRYCFAKKDENLLKAKELLQKL